MGRVVPITKTEKRCHKNWIESFGEDAYMYILGFNRWKQKRSTLAGLINSVTQYIDTNCNYEQLISYLCSTQSQLSFTMY